MKNYLLERSMYYYYNLLSSGEKSLYKTILHAVLNLQTGISVTGEFTFKQVGKISDYVINDRPDIFWYRGSLTASTVDNVIVKIEFDYVYDKNQVYKIIGNIQNSTYYQKINEQLESARSDFEKALKLYEMIIKNCEYETDAITIGGDGYTYAYGVEGILLKRRAVCAGYAKTFQYFANKHNVRTTIVRGTAKNERHAWNLIDLYGEYYYIDATWGDPTFERNVNKEPGYIIYDFFCFTTDELEKSHKPIFDVSMPRCVATKYNYFEFFGFVDRSYSVRSVAQHILNATKKRDKRVFIKYSDKIEYQTAVKKLFDESEIYDAIMLAGKYAESLLTSRISYSTTPERNLITINL